MRYKIDIWHIDKTFDEVSVDPVVHYREPATYQDLSKILKKNGKAPDIRLSEELLTKCNVHAIYTKAKTDLPIWDNDAKLTLMVPNENGSFTQNSFSLKGKPVIYEPIKAETGSKGAMENDKPVTKPFPTKSMVIELAGYLYKPERIYENTKELMKWASASTGFGNGKQQAAPANDERYRKVLLRVMNQKDVGLFRERTHRIVYLPKAMVISYTESFDTSKGLGTFNMVIQQDPDTLDCVIIDAPKAKMTLLTGLSKVMQTAGKVADIASSTVAFAASGVAVVAKGAEMITGKKIKALDEASKGMKDASGAMGGLGGLLGASADRSLSKTARLNKATDNLNKLNKDAVELYKDADKDGKKEWKENEKEAKAQEELEKRQNQRQAMKELDEEMQKNINDNNKGLHNVMAATDAAHQKAVAAKQAQLVAEQEVASANEEVAKAGATENPDALNKAQQNLNKKKQALTAANAAVDTAQTELNKAVNTESTEFNKLSPDMKAAYTIVRETQKKKNT